MWRSGASQSTGSVDDTEWEGRVLTAVHRLHVLMLQVQVRLLTYLMIIEET